MKRIITHSGMLAIKWVVILSLIIGILPHSAVGQVGSYPRQFLEEIVVRFEVPRLVQKDIFVQYDGETIYLPLLEVFSQLELNIEAEFQAGHFEGIYLDPKNHYEIDLPSGKARCFDKTYDINDSLFIYMATELFLQLDFFNQFFQMEMNFNFSELNVHLPLNKDFPSYLKLQRQRAYKELKEKKVVALDVYEIPYQREMLRGGAADWMVSASPVGGRGQFFQLGLGAMFLGGDLSFNGTGNTVTGVESDQINYRWHYYMEDNPYLAQIEIGEINTRGSISRSLRGALVTNRPQVKRKYFQTITVSGYAGEGWDIELYVNNQLIDYTRTDQDGEYNFLLDINYGSTRTLIKKYGPNGEMEVEERFVHVPYNLVPKKTVEYTLAGGSQSSRRGGGSYIHSNSYYGILHSLTAGISTEIPVTSSTEFTNEEEKPVYALESTYKIRNDLIFHGSYAPGYKINSGMNLSIPDVVNFTANYSRYAQNIARNLFLKKQDMIISVSTPIRFGRKRITLRYRVAVDDFKDRRLYHMNYGLSTSAARINLNFLGNYKISKFTSHSVSQIASQVFASTSWIRWIRPQVRLHYDHTEGNLSKVGLFLNKRVFRHGQLTFSYERNMEAASNIFMVTFRIYNAFADFTSKMTASKERVVLTQTQKGSVQFNQVKGKFRFNRQGGVGYGSAVIIPFLDENYNGKREDNEELLGGLRAKMGGAAGRRLDADNLYYYDKLRPYDRYTVQIDKYSLDNPQWLPSHEAYRVVVNPNSVTSIDVPIIMAGEITGRVERQIQGGLIGVGGVKIIVVNETTGKETEITSFNNGEYFYLGLAPGMYRAQVNPKQLDQSGYTCQPASVPFQIKTVADGDYVDNINFVLTPRSN